jgi:hypothetical protein
VNAALAATVAETLIQLQASHQVSADLLVLSESDAGVCQEAMRHRLPGRDAKAGRGGHGGALDGGQFLPVPAPVEEDRHRPGDLPGMDVKPRLGGEGDGGVQDVVLGFEPGQRLLVVRDVLGRDAGPCRGEVDPLK